MPSFPFFPGITFTPFALPSWLEYMREHRGVWPDKLGLQLGGKLYGGYMEDRRKVFDTRHIPTAFFHLGLDFWLPETTPIIWPLNNGEILAFTTSGNEMGGWGGRLDILVGEHVFMFGHLDPSTVAKRLIQNQPLGYLGERKVNGGWQPHLHLQCMLLTEYTKYRSPRDIDAYSPWHNDLSRIYPDPIATLQYYSEVPSTK